MAVKELTDYLENGNIKNSVNFPSCDMGICQTESRVAVLHMKMCIRDSYEDDIRYMMASAGKLLEAIRQAGQWALNIKKDLDTDESKIQEE